MITASFKSAKAGSQTTDLPSAGLETQPPATGYVLLGAYSGMARQTVKPTCHLLEVFKQNVKRP